MFSALRKFLGLIKVSEQGDFVLISGLPAGFIDFSINKIWSTSKIATNMFNRISSNQLVFHRFFVPDVLYTLKVIANDKRARGNTAIIEKVIEEIYENTWAKSILEDHDPFLDRSKLSLFKKNPLDHQNHFFDMYEANTQKYNLKGYLLGAVPGSGKAHSLDVKFKSPTGDILNKNIKVGDVIYDRHLNPTTVTGVYPQGKKAIYKFILEDDRSTEVCMEHLWKVYYTDKEEVINTKDINKLLKQGIDVYIDLPDRLKVAEDKLFNVTYSTKLDTVLVGQTEYRALGGVTKIVRDGDLYQLSVEFRKDRRIKVKSIEYIGIKEAQCISVDNPERLYIVDDYIVTHNTMMSVMLSRMLDTDTNIFVVPKNALDKVWAATLSTELKDPVPFWISNGIKPLERGYKDYVIHFDYLEKALNFFSKYSGEFGNTYINLDESHNFNDFKSNRTQYLVQIARDELKSQHSLFMSGTPIKAVGTEAVPLLRVIDPLFNPKVEERFLKIFGSSTSRANDILQNRMGTLTFKVDKKETVGNEVVLNTGYVSIPNGSDYTLDSIRGEMKRFIEERMRYYKSNASEYAKSYHEILKLHASTLDSRADKQEFENYKKAVELIRTQYDPVLRKDDIILSNKYERYRIIPNLPNDLKKEFRDVKSVYKYYFLKVQGEALGRVLGRLRVQCNVDMLRGMDDIKIKDTKGKVIDETSLEKEILSTTKKTILFTSFVEVVNEADKYLKAKGFKPLLVYGETNKDLANIVSKFANDEDANPLIATFKSLSTAVPLTMANVTVMLNAPFRDYEFQQALARTDRIGQDSTVYCTTVLLDTDNKPNISTRSNDIMDWSKQQIEEILGFKMETPGVSLEDSSDGVEDKAKSLAELLDVGVDDLMGEDNVPIDIDTPMTKKAWSSW